MRRFPAHAGFIMIACCTSLQCLASAAPSTIDVRETPSPPTLATAPLYTTNRSPLAPAAFLKLPIGSITPNGWVRHELELEAQGMTGHLQELSKWCKFEGNAWSSPEGQGHSPWEEVPYWLKGYGDLGYVLKDEAIIASARKWIDAVLGSQEADGWFGPRSSKTSLQGKPDLWPHMVMCNVLQSYYEYNHDERVLPFLTKYFKWLNTQPGENFGAGYWPKLRFGDNIETIYWLYNRTGEPWLLDLSKKIHDHMARWDTDVIDWHNVNISQGFREPGVYFQQSGDRKLLDAAERNYSKVMGIYGLFPGGGFGGDENCRPGYTDPRQGFETCGIVEFMHSFEMLTKISGNPVWADRCEELAFNSLPAAMTPDLKGLHYLTCANQVQLDKNNKAPGVQNEGNMFAYSPYEVYRCCQHNVSHGWPYYAEELWLATPDRGLCVSLYSASEVTARVGEGTVRILEETDYPFGETVGLVMRTKDPVRFPLYLRIPHWCADPTVTVNGKSTRIRSKPPAYFVLERTWKDGDTVTLHLPMQVQVRRWPKNNNAASVDYGPLSFSLKIAEKWTRSGGTDQWPENEVFPGSPWNYGLVLDEKNPTKSFKVVKKAVPPPGTQPFTPDKVPIELQATGRRIPAWKQDPNGLVGKLQPSPVKSEQPNEAITLIPMGAARLRITAFPVIGNGANAREWTTPKQLPVSASHVYAGDSLEAMIDGLEPKNSNDHTIPRFTWWDHRGTSEWVQYDFGKPRKVSNVEVYWFDDTGVGNCRVPESCKVLYQADGEWKPVESASACGTKPDMYNALAFKPVKTTALRLQVQLQPNFSGGVLEWRVRD